MEIEKLLKLKRSNEAPNDHTEYTIWLHNQIIDDIKYELWQHRESRQSNAANYIVCNQIFNFKSLQVITN